MNNKCVKSAVVILTAATVVCGCGSNTEDIMDNISSGNVIEVNADTNLRENTVVENIFNQIDYSYEQSLKNGETPEKLVDSKNFKFEYNTEGYLAKQTIINDAGVEQVVFTYNYNEDNKLISREDKLVDTGNTVRYVEFTEDKDKYYNNSEKEVEYILAEFEILDDWTVAAYNAIHLNGNDYSQIDFINNTSTECKYDTETLMPLSTVTTDNLGNITSTNLKYEDLLVKEIETTFNNKLSSRIIYEYNKDGIENGYSVLKYDESDSLVEKTFIELDKETNKTKFTIEKYVDGKLTETYEEYEDLTK